MTKTKIICTIGPASESETLLRKMMFCGMDVARLNFSHGSHKSHLKRIETVRKLNRKYRRHIRILGDLEGFRIRVGRLKGGLPLKVTKNQVILLTTENVVGSGSTIPFDYHGPLRAIKRGHHIYIDDGNIALRVEKAGKNRLETRVAIAGAIKERKGINIPDAKLEFDGLNAKDRSDIDFCLKNGVDYIAQSFVRNKGDILAVRKHIGRRGPVPKLIAKIENREGIRNIDEIMGVSDGIMVARGDMGVSIPVYEVPVVQKKIIHKCNRAKKFVITATQMLESMVENHIPTRAEVSDVANAIIDGSDYVMLSAETAAGKHPVECVDIMNKIIKYTEKNASKACR